MKLPYIKSIDHVKFILDRCKNKTVLNVGCADWPFTDGKLKRETLLHNRLSKITSSLVGIDINAEGVRLMREFGFSDVYLPTSNGQLLADKNDNFDVVVLGEILEHVLSVGDFMDKIRTVCREDSIILITVPNFAPIKRLARLLWRNEEVHPDHVCYFSYGTLSRMLKETGFEPLEWFVYWRDVGRLSIITNKIFRSISFMQYYADGICVSCRV